jgi:hypothetical protein
VALLRNLSLKLQLPNEQAILWGTQEF